MEFRILGPLEVVNGSDAVSLDAPKLRALLGVLLLHPNEVVSTQRLIDELWGERPPATAAKVVQTYVSQLRRGLDPDAIATRTPGYLLHVEEGALDAERFRHLAAEGRQLAASGEHEHARRIYREALALWRGPALAGVLFESFAHNEVERLEEERISALMDLIDSELALGHHEDVVAELETLVRQHPLRERLRAQLMLALYRCGRQADGLAAYQEARRTLVDELGLEPSRELQDLEKAILTHDPALEAPRRPVPPLQRLHRWRAPAAVVVLGVTLAVVLAFVLGGRHEESTKLVPNSVALIDAKTGRVARSFAVGRAPRALEVTSDSVWVANFRDRTITRIRRDTGSSVTIPVGGHPTGVVAYEGTIWVLTLEDMLVSIDPRFDNVREAVALGVATFERGGHTAGSITAGGGYVWTTVPSTTVVRVAANDPRQLRLIVPDSGARGPIAFHDGEAWTAGSSDVFPIDAHSAAPGDAIAVGGVRGLAFAFDSLWVVSGGPAQAGGVRPALRRVDTSNRLIQTTIPVGSDPVAVAVAGGSVWAASRSDGTIVRVDPAQNRVAATLRLGSSPTALAADEDGVWVTVE